MFFFTTGQLIKLPIKKNTSGIFKLAAWILLPTLPPVIMVQWKMAPLETKVIFQATIFHFHNYVRKGKWNLLYHSHKNPLKYGNGMGPADMGRGSHARAWGPLEKSLPYLKLT